MRPSLETVDAVVRAAGLEIVAGLFTVDESNDVFIAELLALSVADRLRQQVAAAHASVGLVGAVRRDSSARRTQPRTTFDPFAVLTVLVQHRVPFMMLGRLAANARGSPNVPIEAEVVAYIDESAEADERLRTALIEMGGTAWVRLATGAPEDRAHREAKRWWVANGGTTLAVIRSAPPGTSGFADLLDDAVVELAAPGLDVRIPSLLDLVRIADSSSWTQDQRDLPMLWRALELSHRS